MTDAALLERLSSAEFSHRFGHVKAIAPSVIEASGPSGQIGDLCSVQTRGGIRALAQIIALDEKRVLLSPLEGVEGISLGAKVVARAERDLVGVGHCFAGRLVNALGLPLDNRSPIMPEAFVPLDGCVPRPLERATTSAPLETGVRAIDALLPLGCGQRVGIFAASGVGKTSLIEQLSIQSSVDRVVVCLVGERGREVENFWRIALRQAKPSRFTVVAATSDESAALRARAVPFAVALAEYWRARGEHVLLIVDSMTRLAMALRELGLAAGSPPTIRAYTPNIFTAIPRVIERCGGLRSGGAISAIMTVLSETDDLDDPIVELMKSLLDGHILLSRTLADQGHFPAIDVIKSVSRGAHERMTGAHRSASIDIQSMVSALAEAKVMIESGIYRTGTNPLTDRAVSSKVKIQDFLAQQSDTAISREDAIKALLTLNEGAAARG